MAEGKNEIVPFIAYTTAEAIAVYSVHGKIMGKQFKLNVLDLESFKKIPISNAKQSNNMLYILNSNYLGSRKALTDKARIGLKRVVRNQLQSKLDEHLAHEIIDTYKELANGKREIEDLEEHQREFFQELLDTKAIHQKWTRDVVQIKTTGGEHNSTSALTDSQALKIIEEITKSSLPPHPVVIHETPVEVPHVGGLQGLSAEGQAKALEPVVKPTVEPIVETKAKKK
jgi:hypothetical protein